MRHRAEACHFDTQEVAAALGHFETQTEARKACAVHAGTALSWQQPWAGIWNAQGEHSWYRVVSELE
jgi:hypothetical protein